MIWSGVYKLCAFELGDDALPEILLRPNLVRIVEFLQHNTLEYDNLSSISRLRSVNEALTQV